MLRWRSVPVVLAFLSACAPSATQLVVVVDTDMAIPGELDEVRVQVTRPDGTSETEMLSLSTRMSLPLSVAVIAEGEVLGPIDVIATGYRDGDFVIDRSATVTLVRGETRVLSLFLLSNCRDVTCGPGETCGDGGTCEDEEIEDLPPFTGVVPSIDAGVDGSVPRDVGGDVMAPDAPPMVCTDDGDCDDGIACTVDTCDTVCVFQPNDAACDDGNVCTDDACASGIGCVATNNTVPCADDVYCNGTDVCSGGVCTHPGDPCGAPTTCDEATNACVGCADRSDCPADETGAFSTCSWAGDCDEAASRSRTDITYACTGSVCVATPEVVEEPCARETDDMGCGVGSCGGYGACGGFTDSCDESGTETRVCSDLVCAAGECTSRMRNDSRACGRATGGMACGSPSCGAWSPCAYASTCSTLGTQSRSCTDGVCGGGVCGAGGMRTEMQSCGMRSTEGVDCGTSCGSYGACGGFIDDCDERGSMIRSCTPRTCSAGACVTGGAIDESAACTRETDGIGCAPDTCSSGYGICGAGRCTGGSACGGGCICNGMMPFGSCYDPTPPYELCAIK